MKIDFHEVKMMYLKSLEKYKYVLKPEGTNNVYFNNGSNYQFHLYLERYYEDGYFFDLIDTNDNQSYAVWLIFKSFFDYDVGSGAHLDKFIKDYYQKIVSESSWKVKYRTLNEIQF